MKGSAVAEDSVPPVEPFRGEPVQLGADVRNHIRGTFHGAAVQARDISGGINLHLPTPPGAVPPPSQIPDSPATFVGRASDLAHLDLLARQARRGRNQVIVLTGMAGAGKTTLATHWLQQRRRRRRWDGSLLVDLRGFSSGVGPSTTEALGLLLRALGVAASQLSSNLTELSALYRSVTANRKLLILLDNARSASQMEPLLPGPGASLVIVTSRRTLRVLVAGGAVLHRLEPFDVQTGVDLLERLAGRARVAAEAPAARRIVALCGGLPLALAITGARLAARPDLSLGSVSGELSHWPQGTAPLDLDAELSVNRVLDASYRSLDTAAQRAYRMLGLHSGPTITVGLTAAMTGTAVPEAERALDAAVDSHLLEPAGEGHFRFHDLLRLHAQRTAQLADSPATRRRAERLGLEYWRGIASAADQVLMPQRWRPGSSRDLEHARGIFATIDDARSWLEAERANLTAGIILAARRAWHDLVWRLADTLWGLFLISQHYSDRIAIDRLAVAAARDSDSPEVLGLMLNHQGLSLKDVGRTTEAVIAFEECLQVFEQAGHRRGIATSLASLGLAHEALGHWDQAAGLLDRAGVLQAELEDHRSEALTRAALGRVQTIQGRPHEGSTELERARQVFARLPDLYNEARTLIDLGTAYAQVGARIRAADCLNEAHRIMQQLTSRRGEADALEAFGHLAMLSGDQSAARRYQDAAQSLRISATAHAGPPTAAHVALREAASREH
jgi:tetratricopeptide (TPR) repeat protein